MEEIKKLLNVVIKSLYGVDFDAEVTVAPEGVEADYSSNVAMKLAKVVHKSPMEIAEEINLELNAKGSSAGIRLGLTPRSAPEGEPFAFSSVSRPGFLNFILPDEYFAEKMGELGADFDKNISWDEYLDKTVICEFSDPNPFKVLHVGHLYTSVVGDAISRFFEYGGAKVVRANFGGDVGLHVAKTLWALLAKVLKSSPAGALRGVSPSLIPSEELFKTFAVDTLTINDIAKCYVEGTKAYEEDEVARAEITELNKRIYEINKHDEHGNALADLYWRGRELSYDYFKDFYAKIGVKFDKYYPESTVAERGLREVEDGLARGIYEMSDGAVVYRGEKLGLHTRVFINQNGLPTYEAKDVGLIFTKWDDYNFDKSVVITGNDIIDYMKVVLSSVKEMKPELVERTTHLTHGQVKLPGSVKMSSRKGNFLKAVDVLEMVKDELKSAYGSEDEKVVMAAIKYAFLKYKMGGDIIFDLKESVKMTGNSGPYLQYSCVRARKVMMNLKNSRRASSREVVLTTDSSESLRGRDRDSLSGTVDKNDNGSDALMSRISSDSSSSYERTLMKKILEYKGVLREAVREMAPHKVAGYLYELAQEFSRFYENCPVVGSEFEVERGKLVEIYLETMTHGLNLLGIEIPEEM